MLKGQEIVKNRKQIIEWLNRAAAAELQAAYRYLYLSHVASGMHGREVAENFAKMAQSEWGHVSAMMKRIVQLGGRPFERLSDAEKLSYSKLPAPPKDVTDWKKMLKDGIGAEQDAIEFYRGIMGDIHEDPVTLHLIRETLEDEVEDEHELASLLE
ncbi:MAG TPA: ferritin-like domain-containing protein [Candidatus Acidoferrales bacterium]|nr:ferritin-like domain-containing protein [Candidatus Acidoferrales bacterium]